MLSKIKKVINTNISRDVTKDSKDAEKNTISRTESKKITRRGKPNSGVSFGGLTISQIQNRIENAGKSAVSPLITATLGQNAQDALEMLQMYNDQNQKATSIPYTNKLEEIAGFYSEGDIRTSIEKLKNYINEQKGKVLQTYWYMLMDCYQILNNRTDFERIALAYARACGASPPSWYTHDKNLNKNSMTGKNILILPPEFNVDFVVIFKDFLKSARKEKFCRINISQCKFEQSSLKAIKKLYELFVNLRKYKVNAVLMGDNNLIDICHKYMNPDENSFDQIEEFKNEEQFFSLLYLELLQWKGQREEFEEKAIEYANLFHISSPGWEENGIMLNHDAKESNISQHDPLEIDKNINLSNIQQITELILEDFKNNQNSEIDLSKVDYIDFNSIGILNQFIQEIKNSNSYKDKEIILKYPNEMMNVLFKMTGLSEFVTIIPKIR